MNEKDRLYARGDILKEKIYNGDRSTSTLNEFAKILDRLEELQEPVILHPNVLEAKPVA